MFANTIGLKLMGEVLLDCDTFINEAGYVTEVSEAMNYGAE